MKFGFAAVLAMAMVPAVASASYVLTGNAMHGEATIDTGATYSWLDGTNADIVAQDQADGTPLNKMTNAGYVGGGSTLWGSWAAGTTAIAEFDLKDIYAIQQVSVAYIHYYDMPPEGYVGITGMASLIVSTSTDGITFTQWGSLVDYVPAGYEALEPAYGVGFYDVAENAVAARYVRIETSNYGQNVKAFQQVLAEMTIYGDVVPEPMSLSMLALGASALLLRRK